MDRSVCDVKQLKCIEIDREQEFKKAKKTIYYKVGRMKMVTYKGKPILFKDGVERFEAKRMLCFLFLWHTEGRGIPLKIILAYNHSKLRHLREEN